MIELRVKPIFFLGRLVACGPLPRDGEQGYVNSGKFVGVSVS